jgi:hypothetical protein
METVSAIIKLILKPSADGLILSYALAEVASRFGVEWVVIPRWFGAVGLAIAGFFVVVTFWPPPEVFRKNRVQR